MYPQTMITATQFSTIIQPALDAGRRVGMIGISDGSEYPHAFIVSWTSAEELDSNIRAFFDEYRDVCDSDEEFADWVETNVANAELLVEFTA